MKIEYEATFLKIDKESIREKLKLLGAKLIYPERIMKRTVFNPPKNDPYTWLRVWDEGDKITLTLKRVNGDKITDQKEINLKIDNFDAAVEMLNMIGANQKAYQENKRESWVYDGAEIEIDTWPGLSPYVEIESHSEEHVKEVSDKLGFNYEDAYFGAADGIAEMELGIPRDEINNNYPVITFKYPLKKRDNQYQ